MQVFYNTRLALSWANTLDTTSAQELTERANRAPRCTMFSKLFAALAALSFATAVLAYDGQVTGKIFKMDAAADATQTFRVTFAGSPILCTGGTTYAYLSESDPNWKSFISTLQLAFVTNKTVNLYTWKVAGVCHIAYVEVY